MSEKESESAQVYVTPELTEQKYDLDRIVFDLDAQMDLLSSHADGGDYLAAIGSGLICGILDVVWGGAFDLRRGREWSSSQIEQFVVKVSRLTGYPGEDLQGAVSFLEKRFCIPSDKNTPDFGGGLQHHLRDFAHHPTVAGLVFSLLTQFTQKAYGTDTNGAFVIVPVPKEALGLIGKNIPEKLFNGVVVWFFHLVSDMAGSSSTAGKTGGTGIPGPLLAMAKEMAALPVFQDKDGKNQLSVFLSKLFNGTLLAEHDENGKILKDTKLQMDLRGELGLLAELARQALPVAANECMVRAFYMIRRLSAAIQERKADSWQSLKTLDWQKILPVHSPALTRMLTVATGVFTTVDFGAALIGPGKWWVCVNYAGIGRFAVAIGQDVAVGLRARDLKLLRRMYEEIRRNTFRQEDADLYERIGCGMGQMEFGLTMEQVEILYNIEALKTEYDAEHTQWPIHREALKSLKREWLQEWKNYISAGLPSFLQVDHAVMHWYTKEELIRKIEENEPQKPWLRLVLLEAMLFEPYYPLSTEQVKKGKETKEIPSTKYKDLNGPAGYNQKDGDTFLEEFLTGSYYQKGTIARLRKSYQKAIREMKETLKTAITSMGVAAGIALAAVAAAGMFAPAIAVVLVGSNFAGLSGAALTSACLAYLGGGAIAAGGAGMAGGTIAIVGGGAVLGLGAGSAVGGGMTALSLAGKKNTILQSAKLMVSVEEIFLNGEKDLAYSTSVYEQYVKKIESIEKSVVELRLKADVAEAAEKKKLNEQIKEAEDSVRAMRIARKSMNRFISSFEVGLSADTGEPR